MQNFDIVALEPLVDWFNVMTYDLHGTWYDLDSPLPLPLSNSPPTGTPRIDSSDLSSTLTPI